MTIFLSAEVMEAMGFRETIAAGELTASFMSVTVYEVRGVTMPKGFVHATLARAGGAQCRVALADSVNSGCQALIGDDFDESEPDWRKTVKSQGPFALFAVGPTEFLACTAGRVIRDGNIGVTTYEAFPGLRDPLRGLEQRALPPAYSALTLALSAPDRLVSLRKLARASAGRCPDGTQVHDVDIEINADMFVSRALETGALVHSLVTAANSAQSLDQRAAKFFWLGAGEDDQVKRFLYFFLAIEIHTHAIYSRINHRAEVEPGVPPPERLDYEEVAQHDVGAGGHRGEQDCRACAVAVSVE